MPSVFVCLLCCNPFLVLLVQRASSLWVYERDFLLCLQESAVDVCRGYTGGQWSCNPPLPERASVYLCGLSDLCRNRRKRNRRQGKRAGVAVTRRRARASAACLYVSTGSAVDFIDLSCRCLSLCYRDKRFSYLVVVSPRRWVRSMGIKDSQRRFRKRGVNPENLRSLEYVPTPHKRSEPAPGTITKIALLNIRSLNNKTFLINDLIFSRDLDFFLMTETWFSDCNRGSLAEASPRDYNAFNSPRTGGRGGGIATIFKNSFKCRLVTVDNYVSFEVQVFKVALIKLVTFAIIYRPPIFSKFIREFSEFLSCMITCGDSLFILGDFNIHISCPEKPLVQDFLLLLDSFNLTQSVAGATHKQGHTLDLVLSWGVPVGDLTIENLGLSDHFVISFNVTIARRPAGPGIVGRRARVQLYIGLYCPLEIGKSKNCFSALAK